MRNIYYRISELRKAFEEAGLYTGKNIISFTTKIRRFESGNRLRVQKDSRTGHRIFTKKDIKEIVEAFAHNGKGSWFFKGKA